MHCKINSGIVKQPLKKSVKFMECPVFKKK
jgi:hypothetical protein